MNFNDPMAQMRRQQEQMRRQQDDLRRKMAWQQEQDKKRKRGRRQADLANVDKLQSGGVNITDADDLNMHGDIVGRDKVNRVNANYQRDEKSGFALFIERVFTFIFTLLIAGVIFVGIGAVVVPEDAGGMIVGAVLALGAAYVNASSVSRYRD